MNFVQIVGQKLRRLIKIDSPMSVAEQAKIEGVKQRIAEYNRNYIMFMILMFVCPVGGVFFWSSNLYFMKVYDVNSDIVLQVISILLWIGSILCLVIAAYYQDKVTKLREKLEKGEID